MIGFFVNSLVIRIELTGDPTFAHLLEQVREKTLAAFAHQDLPLERIVEELQPDRSLAHNPLFQVMFAYESNAYLSFTLADLAIEPMDLATSSSRFDLEVHVLEDAEGATLVAVYDRDLLDEQLNPIPQGAIGEIYVGGPGLARGYWRDPRKTAERFVPSAWGKPGARLYRSGDLARLRDDETLEYLGRADDQVQIRGHRVEPNEVACRLREHAAVREAFVAPAAGPRNELQLVAYVVPRDSKDPSRGLRAELFDYLKQGLPKWMLPSAIILLRELPRSPQGKVDRNSLPVPAGQPGMSGQMFVSPRDPVEQTLVEIWSDVLGIAQVGIHDDFFELGGHSLLAARVVARIRNTLRVELALRSLFERPTVAMLAASLRGLSGSDAVVLEKIMPAPRDEDLPLSFAQKRLWFLDKLAPGNGAYNVPLAIRIAGPLNQDALRKSWDYLLQRHAALRTSIVERDGQPYQRIAPLANCPLPITDVRHLSERESQTRFESLVRTEEVAPFDLSAGPLFRIQLVRRPGEDNVLLLTLHHIICDGWSINVLQTELSECYAAFRRGDAPLLPELRLHYTDFAYWEQQAAMRRDDAASLEWWRNELAGVQPLRLGETRKLTGPTTENAESLHHAISPELTTQIDELCREHSASRFMLLLAALNVVLVRETGMRDVAVGTPTANRNRAEFERVVGFFVNLLVMRSRIEGNPSFADILTRARETALGAFAHQQLSFERLVEQLQPTRSLESNPFFNILYSFQSVPFEEDHSESDLTNHGLEIRTTRFDLELLVWDHREPIRRAEAQRTRSSHELQLTAVFRPEVFDRRYVGEFLASWRKVLELVVQNPAITLSSLLEAVPKVDTLEPRLAAVKAQQEAPRSSRIEALFAEHALATPDKVAIRDGDRTLTYAELDRQSNALAARLIHCGVQWETPVALLVERSAEAVAAMLAVLKAGGVFVPLPTEIPSHRSEALLAQASVTHVIASSNPSPILSAFDIQLIEFESSAPWTDSDSTRPVIADHRDALAYLMFTSGSTGVPKCVGVTHASIRGLVVEADYVHFSPADVVSQIADMAFDGSTFEIWGALLNGATLDIVDRATAVDPAELKRFYDNRGVTVSFLPTGLFHQLATADSTLFRALRYLIIGGERFDASIVRRVMPNGPARIVNGYGPTETTTFATTQTIVRLAETATSVPIGKPILGVECFVLDAELQPVRSGQRGELYIAGSGLGRGYVNDARLTAERFLPHPFSDEPGLRIYRTGDIVALQPSGVIDFVGRSDDQIKIRGHRVELGEIEWNVQSHPEVHQAVVVLGDQTEVGPTLVCYYLRCNETEVSTPSVEYIENWRSLYDDLYDPARHVAAPATNLIGWNSSYTGQPIAESAMHEQISQTVRRIEALAPTNLLEIGSGTGLLLFRLADRCNGYVATDFSPHAIHYLDQHLAQLLQHPERVKLLERDAMNFDGFGREEFDTIVLNSVVQYFPSADYLVELLRRAGQVIRPGGRIFLGDIRSHSLLRTFHTDRAFEQADDGLSCTQLRAQLRDLASRLGYEVEIRPTLTDPSCFDAAFFYRASDSGMVRRRSLFGIAEEPHDTELNRVANDPLQPVRAREFSARLAKYLAERLPEYMVPARFVMLDRFPLNANGKLDRNALPAPSPTKPTDSENYVEPRTATERSLAAIWSALLQVDRIGRNDNFFQLGGHSLLATQVVTRIVKTFGVTLPLRTLFERQTVGEVAGQIDRLLSEGAADLESPITPVARHPALPLSYSQQRLWFLEQLEPERCSSSTAS